MEKLRTVIFSLLFIFFLSSFIKNFIDYRHNMQFYSGYKQDYETEKKRNLTLKTQILKAKDPFEVEKTIRNKLNLLKNNEVAVIVPEPTPDTSTPTPTPLPNYHQWWNTFFGN